MPGQPSNYLPRTSGSGRAKKRHSSESYPSSSELEPINVHEDEHPAHFELTAPIVHMGARPQRRRVAPSKLARFMRTRGVIYIPAVLIATAAMHHLIWPLQPHHGNHAGAHKHISVASCRPRARVHKYISTRAKHACVHKLVHSHCPMMAILYVSPRRSGPRCT